MKKILSKGYTIEVTSWENDGDNYNTLSITVDNRELAKAISEMCNTIFTSCNNKVCRGIGNCQNSREAEKIIIPFMKEHLILCGDKINPTDKDLISVCREFNFDLMGSSEFYYSRVCESCTVMYSPEDIYAEEIIF